MADELLAPLGLAGIGAVSAPSASRRDRAVELDRAISLVRMMLSVVFAGIVVAHGAAVQRSTAHLEAAIVAAVLVCSLAAWWVVPWLRAGLGRHRPGALDAVLQFTDTLVFLVLAALLSPVAPDVAWTSLVLPIFIAGLRFGPRGILVTWSAAAAGYLIVAAFEPAGPGRPALDSSLAVERPAALLVVAVGVATIAGWLQEGWLEQAQLRDRADRRLDRVRSIADAGRAMRNRPPSDVLETCLGAVPALGFAAATASSGAVVDHAIGDGSLIPTEEVPTVPEQGQVEVTRWLGGVDAGVYNAAVLEPASGTVISGWSNRPIDQDQAQMLADLVAHTTVAYQAANLLSSLQYQATRDPLTGLVNRRQLERTLVQAAGFDGPKAVLMLDLDDFKWINDTYGHQMGDEVLREISRLIRLAVGADGLAARFGGDEFTIVLTGSAALDAEVLADWLIEAIHEPMIIDSTMLGIGVSIGIAVAVAAVEPNVLQHTADRAVYEAKAAGRGTRRLLGCGPVPAVDAAPGSRDPHRRRPSGSESKVLR